MAGDKRRKNRLRIQNSIRIFLHRKGNPPLPKRRSVTILEYLLLPLIVGILVGAIVLLLEYHSGLFQKKILEQPLRESSVTHPGSQA